MKIYNRLACQPWAAWAAWCPVTCPLDGHVPARLGVTQHMPGPIHARKARRLITTWGGDLNDYASRNWSGLMGAYYAKRWQFYLDEAFRSVSAGEEFNDKARREKTSELQNAFAVSTEPVPQPTCYDVLGFSQMLLKKYADELTTFCKWHKQQQTNQ